MWVGEGSTWVADATVLPSGVVTNNYLEVQEALVPRVMTPVVTTPDSVTATPPFTSLSGRDTPEVVQEAAIQLAAVEVPLEPQPEK